MKFWHWLTSSCLLLFISVSLAVAQPPRPDEEDEEPLAPGKSPFNLLERIERGGPATAEPKLYLKAWFETEEGTTAGKLMVRAEPSEKSHTYSITQKTDKPSPRPSVLKLDLGEQVELAGPFSPDQEPEIHRYKFYPGVEVEEHRQAVIWTAPIRFQSGVDPRDIKIGIEFQGQVCGDGEGGSCVPVSKKLTATYGSSYVTKRPSGTFRAADSHVTWEARLEPAHLQPGDKAKLIFKATPDEGYHVYAYEAKGEKLGSSPTLIALKKTSGWKAWPPKTNSPIVREPAPVASFDEVTYHEGPVTWELDLEVPADAAPGQHELAGILGFQTCTDKHCDIPIGATFNVLANVGPAAPPTRGDNGAALGVLAFAPSTYKEAAAQSAASAHTLQLPTASLATVAMPELAGALALALLGGFILNFMPCVLPVIGLKVIQFAEQAGQSRAKILALNLAYCAGLMAVFLMLATLAVTLNFGWGQQFSVMWFQVLITCVIFAMALSFLGVWEIPLPGFIGGAKTSELQQQEGYSGAFFKGVITTILATPCSGPFLGSVFSLTLKYPPYATYLIFTFVGLGMALPYLAIGLQPSLVRWIPKPGAWMETLKQLMGFVLLGTVVYFLATVNPEYRIATFTLMVGIWFACWLIGRTPVYAELGAKLRSWILGSAVATAVGFAAFLFLGPQTSYLPWKDFTPAALADAQAQGKTVMIDFTARWCLTCQANYAFAIDTRATKDVVDKNQVVPMIADWSDYNEEVTQKLKELNSNSIPLLVIYPAGGGEPIVLRDVVTQGAVVAALEEAGPSKPAASDEQTAMTERVER